MTSINKPAGKHSVKPVSRWVIKQLRKERRENPTVIDILKRMQHREFIMSRRHDPKLASKRERYEQEDSWYSTACRLHDQFGYAGATWAGCVQAAKTDWVSEFQMKWGDRIRSLKDTQN